MNEDRRQINKVWSATNPLGETFTYARIGTGKNSYIKTLHIGIVDKPDVELIGKRIKGDGK